MDPVPAYPSNPAGTLTQGIKSTVKCPKCKFPVGEDENPVKVCPSCGWKGEIYVFNPVPMSVIRAQQALPEDATCIHHPTKKAVAVCAGTGDYICALCSIEVKGETYSAEYLNNAGNDQIDKTFDRYLERPDSEVKTLLVLNLIPYVNFLLMMPLAIVWIPYAFYRYSKAMELRRTNPLFARAMRMRRVVGIPILLILVGIGWILLLGAIVYAIAMRV